MTSHEEAIERDWKTPYVLGELPEREGNLFEEHFFDCPTCSESVRTAYLLLRGAEVTLKHPIFGTELTEAPSAPLRKAPRPIRPWAMRAWPYAAVLFLSLAFAREYFNLQKARSPQVVAAFTISAQSKGSTQEVILPVGGGFVELDFDLLNLATQYYWEIRPAGAPRSLMSGQARPAANTLVLKLLVPSNKLHSGRYEADIAVPPSPHNTVYPFSVVDEQERKGAP